MTSFLNDDFLLDSATARTLFHDCAKQQPILDYHCHLSPKEIAEDKTWRSMTELWLGGDHYKWRAMRSDGVEERFITGDASDYEKFEKWAAVMPKLIGNPLYHWTHLELQRYFGIDEVLTPKSCRAIWDECAQKLPALSARQCIRQADCRLVYTTDDPVDDLRWHKAFAEEGDVGFQMLPAWRPDKAVNIEKAGFSDYIARLSETSGTKISGFSDLKTALLTRMDFFHAHGCRNSDHGLDYIPFAQTADADAVFRRALNGEALSKQEADSYKTALLLFLSGEYARRGWVMQLHYGAVRNVNRTVFAVLGPDTGYDAIWGSAESGKALSLLLGTMEEIGQLPKTVLYSLNPADNAQLDAMIGCFQTAEAVGKLQHGAAWWFNDAKEGMVSQLTSLASMSVLGNFIGMLTDSRSFLSYTRHEYFRRILCALLGKWVEQGEYPADMDTLKALVRGICYDNAVRYFNIA